MLCIVGLQVANIFVIGFLLLIVGMFLVGWGSERGGRDPQCIKNALLSIKYSWHERRYSVCGVIRVLTHIQCQWGGDFLISCFWRSEPSVQTMWAAVSRVVIWSLLIWEKNGRVDQTAAVLNYFKVECDGSATATCKVCNMGIRHDNSLAPKKEAPSRIIIVLYSNSRFIQFFFQQLLKLRGA